MSSRVSATDIAEKLSRIDIDSVPIHEQREILGLLEELEVTEGREKARQNFLPFVRRMWPGFIEGRHIHILGDAFDRIISGHCNRLIVNMPPRHSKSEMTSIYLPAYFIGRNPQKKIIQATHTVDLALDFGRKVKNLLQDKEYQEIFPGVQLSADAKASGKWATNQKGEYFAVGISGAVAGKGADLLVIDDVVDEQTGIYGETNPEVYERIYDWYGLVRQRLQPNAAICLVMTRWSKRDLTGKLVKDMVSRPGAEHWEVIEFPAILPSGKPLWPEFWPVKDLQATRDAIPLHRWNAQYQQNPTSQTSALIKRDQWRRWEETKPPRCDVVMASWDTAFEKNKRSDYSACTTWGVFQREDEETGKVVNHLILLNAFRDKWEFPELKRVVKDHYMDCNPDMVIVEKRAAGAPLIYELRQMGIPVSEFVPSKGNDKIARVNAVTDMFASGLVWAPQGRFADEVIEECSDFPLGDHDDYVDTVTQALIRFRRGGFLQTRHDMNDDEEEEFIYRRAREFY